MQVKSTAEHSAVLLTCIKLPIVIKTFVLLFLSGCFTQVLLYELLMFIGNYKGVISVFIQFHFKLIRSYTVFHSACKHVNNSI